MPQVGKKIGRDDWIRTSDPLTPSQVRYQAAPHPETNPKPRRQAPVRLRFVPAPRFADDAFPRAATGPAFDRALRAPAAFAR